MLNARVHNGEGVYGIEFDHMALRVELDEPYLADVGFGEFIREPLRWIEGLEQTQPTGTYRLMRDGEVWRAENQHENGNWWTDYIFTLRPHTLADFAPGCVYQQTSPDSIFTQKRVVTLPTPEGRLTLRDDRLIITRDGQKEEQPIADEAEYRRLLKTHFDIQLDVDASIA
jgi:N-hydroxyarylamine O-acetyltransferase